MKNRKTETVIFSAENWVHDKLEAEITELDSQNFVFTIWGDSWRVAIVNGKCVETGESYTYFNCWRGDDIRKGNAYRHCTGWLENGVATAYDPDDLLETTRDARAEFYGKYAPVVACAKIAAMTG